MVWEPYALAIVFGLLVSAAIYFVVMWPQVEPDEPDEDAAPGTDDAPSTDAAPAAKAAAE